MVGREEENLLGEKTGGCFTINNRLKSTNEEENSNSLEKSFAPPTMWTHPSIGVRKGVAPSEVAMLLGPSPIMLDHPGIRIGVDCGGSLANFALFEPEEEGVDGEGNSGVGAVETSIGFCENINKYRSPTERIFRAVEARSSRLRDDCLPDNFRAGGKFWGTVCPENEENDEAVPFYFGKKGYLRVVTRRFDHLDLREQLTKVDEAVRHLQGARLDEFLGLTLDDWHVAVYQSAGSLNSTTSGCSGSAVVSSASAAASSADAAAQHHGETQTNSSNRRHILEHIQTVLNGTVDKVLEEARRGTLTQVRRMHLEKLSLQMRFVFERVIESRDFQDHGCSLSSFRGHGNRQPPPKGLNRGDNALHELFRALDRALEDAHTFARREFVLNWAEGTEDEEDEDDRSSSWTGSLLTEVVFRSINAERMEKLSRGEKKLYEDDVFGNSVFRDAGDGTFSRLPSSHRFFSGGPRRRS